MPTWIFICKIRAKTCKLANCGPQNTVQVIFFSGILSATKLTTENIVLRSLTPITPHFVDLFGFCIKKKGKENKGKEHCHLEQR